MTGGRGELVEVIFTPHLVPMDRGIFATIHARPRQPAVEHDLLGLYRSFYACSPFIRVVGHLPATKDSTYANYCDITLHVLRGQIVILACLDNIIKGAAGVAVQNLNLMVGCPEETALLLRGRTSQARTGGHGHRSGAVRPIHGLMVLSALLTE